MDLFTNYNLFGEEITEVDNKYTTKVSIPQYLPSMDCPRLKDVTNLDKYIELLQNINKSNISEEEKEFLRLAATRHIVFNYSKIADYYAHATKDVQELMEQSALVIIDVKDAIANGYVKLNNGIKSILEELYDKK